MFLRLIREPSVEHTTLGVLFIDGFYFCWTLEDEVRDVKIPTITAVPAGIYSVSKRLSPHFNRELPWLLDVPNYTDVMIHPGNTDADTDGCILVGYGRGDHTVTTSRVASDQLNTKIFAALDKKEEIKILIENARLS